MQPDPTKPFLVLVSNPDVCPRGQQLQILNIEFTNPPQSSTNLQAAFFTLPRLSCMSGGNKQIDTLLNLPPGKMTQLSTESWGCEEFWSGFFKNAAKGLVFVAAAPIVLLGGCTDPLPATCPAGHSCINRAECERQINNGEAKDSRDAQNCQGIQTCCNITCSVNCRTARQCQTLLGAPIPGGTCNKDASTCCNR